jgi:hypothetical protein
MATRCLYVQRGSSVLTQNQLRDTEPDSQCKTHKGHQDNLAHCYKFHIVQKILFWDWDDDIKPRSIPSVTRLSPKSPKTWTAEQPPV